MTVIGNKDIMAANIQYYLKTTGKTRSEVADALNFKYPTFCDWANGRKYPRIDKIEMLANYFGIEKSDLIEKKTFNPDDKSKITVLAKDFTAEEFEQIRQFINFMKSKHSGNIK